MLSQYYGVDALAVAVDVGTAALAADGEVGVLRTKFCKCRELEAASSLSVVYVGELKCFYITVMNSLLWSDKPPVQYTSQLTPNGRTLLKGPVTQTTFSISTTGMYWVTARAKPYEKPITVTVRIGSNDLLSAFAEKGRYVSASGAFRLQSGSNIRAVKQGGATYEPQTLLSAVYLEGKKKPTPTPSNTLPSQHIWIRHVVWWPRKCSS